jgi:hypothetical protein
MLGEVFYKFLMMIKKVRTDIKFIISGDYNQLKPVNDRISIYTDYANSPCLFELADYNKLELTKCRRADDTLYNLIKFDNIPNVNHQILQKLMNIRMILIFVSLIKNELKSTILK